MSWTEADDQDVPEPAPYTFEPELQAHPRQLRVRKGSVDGLRWMTIYFCLLVLCVGGMIMRGEHELAQAANLHAHGLKLEGRVIDRNKSAPEGKHNTVRAILTVEYTYQGQRKVENFDTHPMHFNAFPRNSVIHVMVDPAAPDHVDLFEAPRNNTGSGTIVVAYILGAVGLLPLLSIPNMLREKRLVREGALAVATVEHLRALEVRFGKQEITYSYKAPEPGSGRTMSYGDIYVVKAGGATCAVGDRLTVI